MFLVSLMAHKISKLQHTNWVCDNVNEINLLFDDNIINVREYVDNSSIRIKGYSRKDNF